jgi:hypothetical protein
VKRTSKRPMADPSSDLPVKNNLTDLFALLLSGSELYSKIKI